MKFVQKQMQGGKTTDLIKVSSYTNMCIVCRSEDEKSIIYNTARAEGSHIPEPITFSKFIKGDFQGRHFKGFLIDNADELLQSLTPVPIITVTATPEEF